MTWFRVDDGLHSHKKAIKAGVEAMGLWVLAGSWCGNQLTDGFIPDYMAQRMDLQAETHAAALVHAGLWIETEVNGERGWQFHDWTSQQPTREQVEADRAAARERMRRRRNGSSPAVSSPSTPPAEGPNGSDDVRANTQRTSRSVRDPRPDPSRPEEREGLAPHAARALSLPDGFSPTDETRAWAAQRRPEVNIDLVADKLAAKHAHSGMTSLDWQGELRRWVLNERALPAAVGAENVVHMASWASATGAPRPGRPAWCGYCDERTRLMETEDDRVLHCPSCHPAAQSDF